MPTFDLGIDKSDFTPENNKRYYPNFLYYKEGKLTDQYYIRNVYLRTEDDFTNEGTHTLYILGECKVGDYLTTCPIKGVAFVTTDTVTAFARAVSDTVRPIDKPDDIILRARVKFL